MRIKVLFVLLVMGRSVLALDMKKLLMVMLAFLAVDFSLEAGKNEDELADFKCGDVVRVSDFLNNLDGKLVEIGNAGYWPLRLDDSFKTLKDVLDNWTICYGKIKETYIYNEFFYYIEELTKKERLSSVFGNKKLRIEMGKMYSGKTNDVLDFIAKKHQGEFYHVNEYCYGRLYGNYFVSKSAIKKLSEEERRQIYFERR